MNIASLLTPPQTIAVVGLSDKPDRASYLVAEYLQKNGFTIIPVNPNLTQVLGQVAYPSITAIPPEIKIDVVEVFRQPDQVLPIIDEVIQSGRKPYIWLQEGVGSQAAQTLAADHGLEIVMDVCMMKEHHKMTKQVS